MKTKILLLFLSLFVTSSIYAQENFTITINGTEYKIALDTTYVLEVDGKPIEINVSQNDTLNFKNEIFSFKYPSSYNLSKVKLDVGIEQIMVMTAAGSGYMVQHYSSINPSFLNEMMLTEVTKESLSYGYEMERTDYTKVLLSGEEIEISQAKLTYKDEINVYEVASYGFKDEGFVIMTMDLGVIDFEETDLITLLWETFKINDSK